MSLKEKEPKERLPEGQEEGRMDQLPAYTQIEETLPEIPPLDLKDPGSPQGTTVSRDQCIAHLKLLVAIADLRDTVGGMDLLFGLEDSQADSAFTTQQDIHHARARIREKRWAVYTARAVDRFNVWWNACVPTSGSPPTLQTLTAPEYPNITKNITKIRWTRDNVPPLDVLMVLHAYMLNPRAFLEDCIRNAKMGFWATGLPWDVVESCIDNRNFNYVTGDKAKLLFENRTGRAWNNLHDPSEKYFYCPRCRTSLAVPWTAGRMSPNLEKAFETCHGFADKGFSVTCPTCFFTVNHEKLKIAKFRNDLDALRKQDLPMPGTLYTVRGVPDPSTDSLNQHVFPNYLVMAISQDLLHFTDLRLTPDASVANLRILIEKKVPDRTFKRAIEATTKRSSMLRGDKIALRRMMSRYWENSSPFALDLVGAVIRQGTFIQKMDNLDWIHSPALAATMDRLIRKYRVFFTIMASYPKKMAVPTLDVDLAWHTHQLSPYRYFEYSVATTGGSFIDHDDKVEETRLADGFEWTSKKYKQLTGGEIYSECTCWYCEATREPLLRGMGVFTSPSTTRSRDLAANLHQDPNISSDPNKNPHISAHSAVRVAIPQRSQIKQLQLRQSYERARRRMQKRNGGAEGHDTTTSRDANRSDPYYYYAPLVWGYPYIPIPYYAPYMCDPGINPDSYAGNPSCMNGGGPGGCVAGTCSGAGGCGFAGGAACGNGAGCGSSGGGCGGGGGSGGGGCGSGGCGGGGCGGGGCGGGGGS